MTHDGLVTQMNGNDLKIIPENYRAGQIALIDLIL